MISRLITIVACVSLALAETCHILPADSTWPGEQIWDAFNRSVDGRLIKTIPIGSPCHDPTFDQEKCDTVRRNWHIPDMHQASPSSVTDSTFLNKSCDPFDPRDTPCRVGAYVQYAVNVSQPQHIAKTTEFVKKHNIRFIVKNTGHDYMGRPTGTGAISIWTHHLQDIEYIPQFKSSSYTGPAFKAYAGVHGYDLLNEAHKKGLAVVVGECPTVGFTGGYIQGGGHSGLSSIYGLAADQTLEFEVMTTQGKFVHASPSENQDLYWALSGGGGGTYGIVWSVTVKAFKELPVTLASLNFSGIGISQDTFWKAFDAYQTNSKGFSDAKLWAITQYTNMSLSAYPIFAVNKSAEEVSALLRPLLDTLGGLGVNYTSDVTPYSNYFDAYASVGYLARFPVGTAIFGSRLLPTSLWESNNKLTSLLSTIRNVVEGGASIFEIMLRPTSQAAGNPNNAVHPAWRKAERQFAVSLHLFDGEPFEKQMEDQKRLTTELIPQLKSLTPGSGAYLNEADPFDPDWKEAFYGPNYDRLLSIKDKWDPNEILYGRIAVGGDRWYETEDGRLCKANDV